MPVSIVQPYLNDANEGKVDLFWAVMKSVSRATERGYVPPPTRTIRGICMGCEGGDGKYEEKYI